MQPTNAQPRGSFSKPAELVKSIEEHEIKPKPQPQSVPEAPKEEVKAAELTSEQKIEQAEAERAARIRTYKEEIERDLDITLTDEDVKNYLLKGRLSKEVTLIKGMMKGTMQTARIVDLQEVDTRMAKIRAESTLTSKGIENEEAIIALSYAWTHADGRPLGNTPVLREERIRQMGSLFIERASGARVSFDTLVRLAMQERGLLKK